MSADTNSAQDSPITFNAFKQSFDSNDEKDSTEADQEKAHKFQAAIKARFADESGVKFGAIHPKALGPHPMPQFQITFTKSHLMDVLPWLMFNRPEEFSILVHPFTAKPAEDHDSSAVWLGKQLQCHLQPMEQLQQHVATEVQAGKDKAALLWRFV